ncbi:dipeptidase [Tumebacillus sp. ITR2]|uniref:Dipeptidase n=1 Tax=Tumebacillus amylolyticus TaxID=2801339 RepID=A0ABS1JDW5_9BACL|nr:dipeptidase [Tumebacillus amylolyticus]MBL0388477.1 dipeptidase [Tumebacillus amylolyticus]
MEKMYLIDGHADILYRMEKEGLDFHNPNSGLHLGYDRLAKAGIDLQFFVLFSGPPYTPEEQLTMTLGYIDTFYEVVCKHGIRPVLSRVDLQKNLELGVRSGLLSIEGGDLLQGDIRILRMMYRMGVRAMGLTWNNGNCIADGVGEVEDRGLTAFGRQVVQEMNSLGMVVDVAHLAPRGFWDVMELSQAPVIASHANASAIHDHRRNLTDDQLKALFKTNGLVGVTYVPAFICNGPASISHLMRHIDHILSLGGENHLGFGSDFDGIETTMTDLEHGEHYHRLIEAVNKAYGDDVTRKICGGNFKRVLESILKE